MARARRRPGASVARPASIWISMTLSGKGTANDFDRRAIRNPRAAQPLPVGAALESPGARSLAGGICRRAIYGPGANPDPAHPPAAFRRVRGLKFEFARRLDRARVVVLRKRDRLNAPADPQL